MSTSGPRDSAHPATSATNTIAPAIANAIAVRRPTAMRRRE